MNYCNYIKNTNNNKSELIDIGSFIVKDIAKGQSMRRVKFYSKDDLSVNYYIKRIETVDQQEVCMNPSIIDLIEYKNIIDFYENFPNEAFISNLTKKKSFYYTEINKYYKMICELKIIDCFKIIERSTDYWGDDFIKLIQKFDKLSLFDNTELKYLILLPSLDWNTMLKDDNICYYIKKYENYTALIDLNPTLLRTLVMEYVRFEKLSIIPKDKIETYVEKYIDNCRHVIDLLDIENTKFRVDAQLKLKARLNRKKLEKKQIVKLNTGIEYVFGYSNDIDKIEQKSENGRYTEIWNFDEFLTNGNIGPISYKQIYAFCIHFLGVLNPVKNISDSTVNCDIHKGLITLFSTQHNSYTSKNINYNIISQITLNRLNILTVYLGCKNFNIYNFLNYLVEILMNKGFYTINDSENYYTNSLIAINKHLCTQIDSILSQYECYQRYGKIDKELVSLNGTKSINFQRYNSLLKEKNIYPLESNIYFQMMDKQLKYSSSATTNSDHLYSDIKSGNIKKTAMSSYDDLAVESINYLFDENIVYWASNTLRFVDSDIANVMENLFRYGSIPISELAPFDRLYDKLNEKKLVTSDSKLFNKHEIEYFHYVLNDRDHNGSLALRNEYIHTGEVKIGDELANIHLIKVLLEIIIKIQYEIDFTASPKNT